MSSYLISEWICKEIIKLHQQNVSIVLPLHIQRDELMKNGLHNVELNKLVKGFSKNYVNSMESGGYKKYSAVNRIGNGKDVSILINL